MSLRFNRVRGYITRDPSIAGAETGWCFAGSRKKADSQLAAFFLAQEGGRRSEVIKEHLSSLPFFPEVSYFEEKWRTGNLRFHSNESDVT